MFFTTFHFVFLILSFASLTECNETLTINSYHQKLRKDLLQSYDLLAYPVLKSGKAVEVKMSLTLHHYDLDEHKAMMMTNVWLLLNWKDPLLKWNPKDYDGIAQTLFGPNEIWKPDIDLYNSADYSKAVTHGETPLVVVTSTGDITWIPPMKLMSFCDIDLKYWPYDEQTCKLKFGSWTHNGDQIDLNLFSDGIEVNEMASESKEWTLARPIKANRTETYYECCPESYVDISYTFHLSRVSKAYTSLFIMPCIVILMLVVSSFLISTQCNKKLLLNALALLCSIAFIIYFANTLPFYSAATPIIVTFYSNTVVLIGFVILLNVVCSALSIKKRPPKFLNYFFNSFVGRLLCLRSCTSQRVSTYELHGVEQNENLVTENRQHSMEFDNSSSSNNQSGFQNSWILIATGIERIFFVIYLICFITITIFA